jgi:hypothetical protein
MRLHASAYSCRSSCARHIWLPRRPTPSNPCSSFFLRGHDHEKSRNLWVADDRPQGQVLKLQPCNFYSVNRHRSSARDLGLIGHLSSLQPACTPDYQTARNKIPKVCSRFFRRIGAEPRRVNSSAIDSITGWLSGVCAGPSREIGEQQTRCRMASWRLEFIRGKP